MVFLVLIFSLIFPPSGATVLPQGCEAILDIVDAPNGRLAYYKQTVSVAENLAIFARSRYGAELGISALEKLSSLSTEDRVLIGDPGVVLRIDEFIAFAKLPENIGVSGWSLREKFKVHLGTVTVWRGMALSQETARKVNESGIDARFLRPEESAVVRHQAVDPFTHNIFSMINERVFSFSETSSTAPSLPRIDSLLSVTEDPDIAKSVTRWVFEDSPELEGYLYEIELPRLDLVFDPGSDPAVESFVLFRVQPGEIKSIEIFK